IAAVQTFRGISLIDFGSLTAKVLPQSNDVVARQLLLAGTTLVELTDATLRVSNTQTQILTAELTLPTSPISFSLAPNSIILDLGDYKADATINEGGDAQALSIATVKGAVWA